MRVALDTHRYTDLCRGDEEVVRLLEGAEAVYLPFLVLAELRAGFAVGARGSENEVVLQRFLAKPGVQVLYPSSTTWPSPPATATSASCRSWRWCEGFFEARDWPGDPRSSPSGIPAPCATLVAYSGPARVNR